MNKSNKFCRACRPIKIPLLLRVAFLSNPLRYSSPSLCGIVRIYTAAVLGIRPLADHTPQDHLARAIWTLREALRRFELAESYACAILRDRGAIGPDLDTLCHSAGPQTVRQVTYTITNRGRAKLRKNENLHQMQPVP